MGKEAKRAQRAAQKRKRRQQRVLEDNVRRRAAANRDKRSWIQQAADLPVDECLISKGWQKRGLAHILLARRAPDESLVVAGYYVDTLCVGLKDTAVMTDLTREEYEQQVKPTVFNDPVELEPCEPSSVRALIEGAIEFAGRFGFRPNKRWKQTHRLLEGIVASSDIPEFGREGKPCLVLRAGQSLEGALRRLERVVGAGNYLVVDEREEQTAKDE